MHRELTVHPFFVVRGDGERIRVEPTVAESRLFDEIEDEILFQEGPLSSPASTTWRRTRAATLRPDEHVWVTGGLQRVVAMEHLGTESSAPMGYRESAVATSFVMRGDPSLLVSTVSLASHFRQRSRKHARHAFYLLMTLTVPSLVLANYMDRVRGETIFGAVETVDAHHGKHGYVIDYGARVRHARGTSDGGTFEAAPVLGSMLPVRVGEWSDNPGTTARLMGAEWTFAFLSCLVAMIVSCVTVGSAVNSLPWYRSDRVKLNEHGLGRLPRNPPQGAKAPSG